MRPHCPRTAVVPVEPKFAGSIPCDEHVPAVALHCALSGGAPRVYIPGGGRASVDFTLRSSLVMHHSASSHTGKSLMPPPTPIVLGRTSAVARRAPFGLGDLNVHMAWYPGKADAAMRTIVGLMAMEFRPRQQPTPSSALRWVDQQLREVQWSPPPQRHLYGTTLRRVALSATRSVFLFCHRLGRHACTVWTRGPPPGMASGYAYLAQDRRPASRDASVAKIRLQHHVACGPTGGCLSR